MSDKMFVAKNGVLIQNSNTALTQNNLFVGNSSVNASINSTSAFFGNSTVNASLSTTSLVLSNSSNSVTINPTSISVGTSSINTTGLSVGALTVNSSVVSFSNASINSISIGNSTVNSSVNSTSIQIANSTSSINLSSSGLIGGIITINSSVLSVGANNISNASAHLVGNSTVYSIHNSTLIQVVSATGTANITPASIVLGISSVNSSSFSVGSNVVINASSITTPSLSISNLSIGNSTVNSSVNSTFIQIANSSSSINLSSSGITSGISSINLTNISVGSNNTINATAISSGNTVINSSTIALINLTSSMTITPGTILTGSIAINSTAFRAGGNSFLNESKVSIGNSTVYANLTNDRLNISDTNATLNLYTTGLKSGSLVVNTSAFTFTDGSLGSLTNINSTSIAVGPAAFVWGGFYADGNGLNSGNTSVGINYGQANGYLYVFNASFSSKLRPYALEVGNSVVNTIAISIANTSTGSPSFFANSSLIKVGNSTVNSYFDISGFHGTADLANNSTNLNGQAASYYLDLGNATGSLGSARISNTVTYTANVWYAVTHLYSQGNIYAQGDVYAAYSDIRLKKNISKIENALDKVNSLNGITYYQNDEVKGLFPNNKKQVGLIAQEVKEILPEVISLAAFDLDVETGKSISGNDYLTVNYDKIVPLLVEAIKELSEKVKKLEGN